MGLRLPADLSGAGMKDMREGCMDIDSVDILDVRQGTTERTWIWSNHFTKKTAWESGGVGRRKVNFLAM